jgi:SOS-response transcriptional repressor LexA
MYVFDKRLEILKAIYEHIEKSGYPPTIRELCELVGLKSTSTVHSYIRKLKEEGYLFSEETYPRTLVITEKGLELLNVEIKESSKIDYNEYKIILGAQRCLKENSFAFINEFEEILNKLILNTK